MTKKKETDEAVDPYNQILLDAETAFSELRTTSLAYHKASLAQLERFDSVMRQLEGALFSIEHQKKNILTLMAKQSSK